MSFLADVLTEETFYDNITLGLIKILENTPGVEELKLGNRQPCERGQLSSWEQRHSSTLPTDMRQFYLSVDGFKLTWSYQYAGDLISVGNMNINSISELKRLSGLKIQGEVDYPSILDLEPSQGNKPHFGAKCKIFEIDSCQGNGRVCLVYIDKQETETENKKEAPRIWFLDRSFEWHFLADNFTQYFRMMLVHYGLPMWQLRFTTMGLTPFAERIMSLIAPHLLQSDLNKLEKMDAPPNFLDPSVFKSSKTKSIKKKSVP